MPKCCRCADEKPQGHFVRSSRSPSGFSGICLDCNRKRVSKQAAARKGPQTPVDTDAPSTTEILKAVRGTVDFSALCDKLDLSPRKTQAAIDKARKEGVQIHVEHQHVGLRIAPPSGAIQSVGVEPTVGETQRVAVASDLHLGSKYALLDQLRDFLYHAHASGVEHVLIPGDVLEGCYRHATWEVSHSGLDDQADYLLSALPQLHGLSYHAITGNHDFTFSEKNGVDVGDYLSDRARARGRKDLKFYGNRSAFLRVGGATIHLWHPKQGMAYARSYPLQKQVERYAGGEKPHILLAGHWHQYCHVYERGVHAIACPTFQGGGSAFAKSLGGSPSIGGLILEWDLTEHGTMRDLRVAFRAYFEVERPRSIGT